MDPVRNPYAPGAGQRPPELAGRDAELADFSVLLQRLELGRAGRGVILTGLRGVGKTVLLTEFRAVADQRGWVVAMIEAASGRPFRLSATQALHASLRAASVRHRASQRLKSALGVFKAFSLKAEPDGSLSLGIDVEASVGRADTGDLELDLSELFVSLGEAARDLGKGVVLFIDELQELPKADIAAVAGATHRVSQEQLPVAVVGAGLPNLPAIVTAAKSYAERLFVYQSIGGLTPEEAEQALVRPAEELDVAWSPEAVELVVAQSAGYPFFLQAFADASWDHAVTSPITAADAKVAITVTRTSLDNGFYGSRWERATPGQRQYLRAMAVERGASVPTRSVAQRLGKRPNEVTNIRDQLIRKGLIYPPERGYLRFTVPGMDEFIRRQQ